MLDIIRKKASAWGIKIIFGIIIVVFVFFFGYNRISQRYKTGKGGIAAKVNGTVITMPEYQLAYQSTSDMYKKIFKSADGETLPDGVEQSIRSTTINKLIQEEIVHELGKKLDTKPTKEELADAIKNSPVAKDEAGQFDPFLYKQRFLPYFFQKYNIEYESLVSGDLMIQKVNDLFDSAAKDPLAKGLYNLEKTKWTFEVAEKGGKPKKVGPISISERGQLFEGQPELADYQKVFGLRNPKDSVKDPIKVGDKEYSVKLVKLEEPTNDTWLKEKEGYIKSLNNKQRQEFFQTWVSALQKNAKTQIYIEQ